MKLKYRIKKATPRTSKARNSATQLNSPYVAGDASTALLIYANIYGAAKFTASAPATRLTVTLDLAKAGTPPNALQVHLYSSAGGRPSASIANATIAHTLLSTGIQSIEVTLTTASPNHIETGEQYFILLKTEDGSVAPTANLYSWYFRASTDWNYLQTTDATTWTEYHTRAFRVVVTSIMTVPTFQKYIDRIKWKK